VYRLETHQFLTPFRSQRLPQQDAKTAAAEFIKEGLLKLGPSFVKLGQVVSTRTDVLAPEFIEVLKTLQDDVPAFSGSRAKRIVMEELGLDESNFDKTFKNFR
jgi:predicted unusual protein kinase regulating ubiquinone biosynthesis (AarF/ABC1/UbiB family)